MIGIYGGTFDPIHFGHLRPALDVLQSLQLEQVRFIPCGNPPHRDPPFASSAHRLQMLQRAVDGISPFVIDDREIRRGGTSYMVDTVQSLQQEFSEAKFALIVGLDAFIEFHTWKDWQVLVQRVSLVVTQRPNTEIDTSQWHDDLVEYVRASREDDVAAFVRRESPAVYFCPVTQLDISSTHIRELVANGQRIDFLLPSSVVDYIEQNSIY